MLKSRLSSLSLGLLAASFLMSSVTFAANYKSENYKGEYKGEAMPVVAPCKVLKDGFYVGAQIGYDSYRIRESVGATVPGLTETGNPVLNATGFAGGLMAGYGQYFSQLYYLGAEIFVNTSGASENFTMTSSAAATGSYYSKFSVSGSYGIGLLPGVKLNDSSLLYIRLGWNRANLKGQETLTAAGAQSDSNSNWESGFNYGLGLESVFYDNFSVRGEYTHTDYSSFTNYLNNTSAGTKFTPSDNQFMLGLIYHFA
jgi:opacity protein-like surface antigen